MTLSEIEMNYSKATRQARDLIGIAARLEKQATEKMETILNEVRASWESDNSPQYLKKCQKVQTDIRTTAKNLRAIGETINTIAGQIRNAELEAWRIANERDKT